MGWTYLCLGFALKSSVTVQSHIKALRATARTHHANARIHFAFVRRLHFKHAYICIFNIFNLTHTSAGPKFSRAFADAAAEDERRPIIISDPRRRAAISLSLSPM